VTRYLDIGVVRIQGYLTRAPNLKSRRGASTMISDASRDARATAPPGTAPNTQAGLVDGVVSFTLTDGQDGRAAAGVVLAQFRRALPAAELYAAVWEGDTYPGARNRPAKWEEHWPPAVPEWPLAKPCDWCRTWPATSADRVVDGGTENYCPDCLRRAEAAGAAHARTLTRNPGPERDLLERMPCCSVPDDFDELAALGAADDHTHVATIYADGNSIGAYMKAQRHRPELAAEIHEATWAAVTGAVGVLAGQDTLLPVIPHLVGGDDVLISVPAHTVWPGLRALLAGFEEAFPDRSARPTLSAGVVVHHRQHPLSDVVDLASALLSDAKHTHVGRAAFGWHSITHDGAVPTDRPAVSLDVLTKNWAALAALYKLSAAARQQLSRFCRDDLRRGDRKAFQDHVKRIGAKPVVEPFEAVGGMGLEDALAMLRWWQP
jgi:hypothetical protein